MKAFMVSNQPSIHFASTLLTILSTKGIINAGYKVNQAYRTMNECADILVARNKWESKLSHESFESLVLAGQGAFEMMLSFFPSEYSTSFFRLIVFLASIIQTQST